MIVFHIQAGMDSSLCLATWLAGSVQSEFEPAKVLRSFRYAQLHAALTFSNVGVIKGLSFISNRQRRKEGTFRASGLAGIEPTPARSGRAGYARLNLSATAGVITYYHSKLLKNPPVTSGGYPPNHNILSFEAVGNPSATSGGFIIPHLILTPLSLSASCRRPVQLQEGPRGIQHCGRRL